MFTSTSEAKHTETYCVHETANDLNLMMTSSKCETTLLINLKIHMWITSVQRSALQLGQVVFSCYGNELSNYTLWYITVSSFRVKACSHKCITVICFFVLSWWSFAWWILDTFFHLQGFEGVYNNARMLHFLTAVVVRLCLVPVLENDWLASLSLTCSIMHNCNCKALLSIRLWNSSIYYFCIYTSFSKLFGISFAQCITSCVENVCN